MKLNQVFPLDITGGFIIRYELTRPGYFRIGRNILYLYPGDSLQGYFDYNDPEKATFTGKNGAIQEFLRYTPYPKAGSYLGLKGMTRSTIDSTISLLQEERDKRYRTLKAQKFNDSVFVRLERTRIHSDFINSIVSLGIYFPYVNNLEEEGIAAFRKAHESILSTYTLSFPINDISEYAMELVVFRKVSPLFIRAGIGGKSSINQWKAWNLANGLADSIHNAKDVSDPN